MSEKEAGTIARRSESVGRRSKYLFAIFPIFNIGFNSPANSRLCIGKSRFWGAAQMLPDVNFDLYRNDQCRLIIAANSNIV